MSAGPTIAVLTHPTDRFHDRRYFLRLLLERWRGMGMRAVVVHGPHDFAPADVAILHLDVSLVPDAWHRLAERYPRVINGRVRDIRRRSFSRLVVAPGDAHRGRTIVKTNRNCGGVSDFRHAVLDSPLGRLVPGRGARDTVVRAVARIDAHRSWRRRRLLPRSRYPLFPNLEAVPAAVWRNPHLVVERFVAERSNGSYSCRHWMFIGDREINRRTWSAEPVVKLRGSRMENLADPVPEELRALRRELGFDYGKFDYGIVDGEVVLYDVNPTPGSAQDPRIHAAALDILADGILPFLAGTGAPA